MARRWIRGMPRRREIPLADIEGKSINPNPVPHSLGPVVDEALERLSEEDQDLLRSYFWERLSYSQIAQASGLAGKTSAAWRVNAALARLKVELEKEGVDYE